MRMGPHGCNIQPTHRPNGSVFSIHRLHRSRNQTVEEKLTLLTITLSDSLWGINALFMHKNRLRGSKDFFPKREIFLPGAQQKSH